MKKQVVTANSCRLYLKILSVTDTATWEGTSACQHILDGTLDINKTRQLNWPVQGKPG